MPTNIEMKAYKRFDKIRSDEEKIAYNLKLDEFERCYGRRPKKGSYEVAHFEYQNASDIKKYLIEKYGADKYNEYINYPAAPDCQQTFGDYLKMFDNTPSS